MKNSETAKWKSKKIQLFWYIIEHEVYDQNECSSCGDINSRAPVYRLIALYECQAVAYIQGLLNFLGFIAALILIVDPMFYISKRSSFHALSFGCLRIFHQASPLTEKWVVVCRQFLRSNLSLMVSFPCGKISNTATLWLFYSEA